MLPPNNAMQSDEVTPSLRSVVSSQLIAKALGAPPLQIFLLRASPPPTRPVEIYICWMVRGAARCVMCGHREF